MDRFLTSKEIEFDAGHRVPDHEGKCSNPHGHRYRVVLHVKGVLQERGSRTGMVLDFAEIKKVLQEIHDQYDHGFIYTYRDEFMRQAAALSPTLRWVRVDFSPTAENLAREFFEYAQERFDDLHLPGEPFCVEVWETPTSCAQFPA